MKITNAKEYFKLLHSTIDKDEDGIRSFIEENFTEESAKDALVTIIGLDNEMDEEKKEVTVQDIEDMDENHIEIFASAIIMTINMMTIVAKMQKLDVADLKESIEEMM